jgi:hypothetical protein
MTPRDAYTIRWDAYQEEQDIVNAYARAIADAAVEGRTSYLLDDYRLSLVLRQLARLQWVRAADAAEDARRRQRAAMGAA